MRYLIALLFCLPVLAQKPVSDDFRGTSLRSVWTASAPTDSTVSVSNGLILNCPAGSNHNPDNAGSGNGSPHVTQLARNTDFDLLMKYDTLSLVGFNGEGIMFIQDDINYLRFEIGGTGSFANATVVRVVNNSFDFPINTAVATSVAPIWLRVKRSGNSWNISTSFDGSNFTDMGTISQTFTISSMNLYAYNFNSNPSSAVAFSPKVEFFHNLLSNFARPFFFM